MAKLIACFFIFLTSLSTVQAADSQVLGYETNGGDAVCAEFLEVFDSMIEGLSDAPLTLQERNTVDALVLKRKIVRLSSEPELYLDGVEKDAINYSGIGIAKIEISRKSWARLTKAQKSILVLHEMLPIAGYFDKDYALSLSLNERAKQSTPRSVDTIGAFLRCDREKLNSMTLADIRKVSHRDMPAIALTSRCELAYGVLIRSGWDFNLCDDSGKTALADTMEQMALWDQDSIGKTATADEYRHIKMQHETIISIIKRAGGTMICSGVYEEYQPKPVP